MRFPFQRRKALTGTPEVVDAMQQGWSPLPMLGGGARQRIVEAFQTAKSANYAWMYRKSPAVRSVVDVIVRNVGQLDLRLYEEVDDSERQPAYDHPAALSLRYPSETVPGDQFVRTMFRDYLTAADAVALMLPGPNQTTILKWVPISRVQFMGSNMFDADVYRVHDQLNGTFSDWPAEQVLHWRGENPDDPRIGLSHLETLRSLVAEDAAMQQANVELAQSGLTEPSWVFRPLEAPGWSNEARGRFEEDLRNRIKRGNTTPVVLEEGMELRPFGVSPKDAQSLDLRQWIKGQVADEYGVPRGMVGLSENVEEARSAFYSDCLPPYCEEFTRMLNLRILVRVYGWTDGCFAFNLDEKQMGDERIKTLVSATGRALMTTDEGRAKLNLPPIDGGDELVTPLNVMVGTNPKPSPQIMPPQDPNGPPQDGSHREDVPPKALEPVRKQLEVSSVPRPERDIARQRRYVDEATAMFERHYRRLQRSMREKALKAVDTERWDVELARDIERTARSIVEREGGIYAARFGGEFDMRQVENYLKAMAEGAATAINEVTQADIDELGPDGAFERARNERIPPAAASVGVRSTVFSRQEAARQSPGAEHRVKTWVADTDRHASLNGATVPLNESFGGINPGGPPNCRCTMTVS